MAIVGLAALDPLVALLVAAPVALAAAATGGLLPALVRRTRRAVRADEAVSAAVTSTAVALRDVLALGAERRADDDVRATIQRRAAAQLALARAVAWRSAIAALGGTAPLLALLASTPWLLRSGRLTVGGVLGAIVYVSANLQPALHGALDAAATSLVRRHVLVANLSRREPPDPAATEPATGVVVLHEPPHLRAEALSFARAGGAQPIVDGVDLTIADGRHLAVVGPSGVGKSTLVDLLTGLIAPDAGRVSIAGVDLRHIPRRALRRLVTVVPQEAFVFAGSMRDNLTYLRPEATDAELLAAAEATGLRDVIDRLGGLDASPRRARAAVGGRAAARRGDPGVAVARRDRRARRGHVAPRPACRGPGRVRVPPSHRDADRRRPPHQLGAARRRGARDGRLRRHDRHPRRAARILADLRGARRAVGPSRRGVYLRATGGVCADVFAAPATVAPPDVQGGFT